MRNGIIAKNAGDVAGDGVDGAAAEQRVVPAFVEQDEPLDQRQAEQQLADDPDALAVR